MIAEKQIFYLEKIQKLLILNLSIPKNALVLSTLPIPLPLQKQRVLLDDCAKISA